MAAEPNANVRAESGHPLMVPELEGMGPRQAVHQLFSLGLVPHLSGGGVVEDTVPAAGSPVRPGAPVLVLLRSPIDHDGSGEGFRGQTPLLVRHASGDEPGSRVGGDESP